MCNHSRWRATSAFEDSPFCDILEREQNQLGDVFVIVQPAGVEEAFAARRQSEFSIHGKIVKHALLGKMV